MKWLPREKRNPFFAVILITAGLVFLICFVLISSQYETLAKIVTGKKMALNQLQNIESMIKNGDITANELADVQYTLTRAEEDVATGDLYSWIYDTIRRFKQPYHVDIPEVGHPTVGEVDLLPSFPYKQMRFGINGTAYYHDLGKFVADFENNFPHARIVNLVIEPQTGVASEKLSFRMEIVALVKINPS